MAQQPMVPVHLPEFGAPPAPSPADTGLQPSASPTGAAGGVNKNVFKYDQLIDAAAQRSGVDPNLLRAIIHTESRGRPDAVSEAGAVGLMQLLPGTARRFGVTDLNDPAQNIAAGASYMRHLLDRYNGDYDKAVAAYHAGEGNLDKYLQGKPSAFGPRSTEYPLLVRRAYESLVPKQTGPATPQPRAIQVDPASGLVIGKGGRRIDPTDTGAMLAAMNSGVAFADQVVPGAIQAPAEQVLSSLQKRARGYAPLLGAATDTYQAGYQELAGAALQGLGLEGAAASMFADAEANRAAANAIRQYSDIPQQTSDVTLGNFGSYIAGQLVSSAPWILEFVGTGGVGSAAGKVIGKAAAARAIAARAEALAAERAAQLVSKGVPGATAQAMANQQVLTRMAPLVANAERAASQLGSKVGSFGAGALSGFGDIANTMRESGGEMDYGYAAAMAPVYSALNFLGLEGQLGKTFGLAEGAVHDKLADLTKQGLKGRLKAGLVGGTAAAFRSAPGEVINEIGQEIINQGGTPGGVLSPEAMRAYTEAAAGALAASGGMAGTVGAVRGAFAAKAPVATTSDANPDRGAGPIEAPAPPLAQQGDLFTGEFAPVPGADHTQQPAPEQQVGGEYTALRGSLGEGPYQPTAEDLTGDLFNATGVIGAEAGYERGFVDRAPSSLAGRIARGDAALRAQMLSNPATRDALVDMANGRTPDLERLQRMARMNPDNGALRRVLAYAARTTAFNPEADVANLARREAAVQQAMAEQEQRMVQQGMAGPQPGAPVQGALFGAAEVARPMEPAPQIDEAARREMAAAESMQGADLFPPEPEPQRPTDVLAYKRWLLEGAARQRTNTLDQYADLAAEALAANDSKLLRDIVEELDARPQPVMLTRMLSEKLIPALREMEARQQPRQTKDESLPNLVDRRTTSATAPLAPDVMRGAIPGEFLTAAEARQQRRMKRAPKPLPQAAVDEGLQQRIDQRILDEELQAEYDARQAAGERALAEGVTRPRRASVQQPATRAPSATEKLVAEVVREEASRPAAQLMADEFRASVRQRLGDSAALEFAAEIKSMRAGRGWVEVSPQEVAEVAAAFDRPLAKSRIEERPSDLWDRLYSPSSAPPATKFADTLAKKLVADAGVLSVTGTEPNLPQWMKDDIAAGNKGAFYFDGKHNPRVVVYERNIADESDRIRTVLHEVVGHGGLFSLLGDKTNGVLEGIYRSNLSFRTMADLMMHDGVPRVRALQEAMAIAAEDLRQLRGWRAFVAKVREVLRELLGSKFVSWSDNDVIALLNRAAKAPISGATLGAIGGAGTKLNRGSADVTNAVKNATNEIKSLATGARGLKYQLAVLTPAQIVRTFKPLFDADGVNHLEQFHRAERRAESIINGVDAEIQPLTHRIAALQGDQERVLAEVMNKATALRVYPDRPYAEQPWLRGDQHHDAVTEAEYDQLVAEWSAMTAEQRQLAKDIWGQFAAWRDQLHTALKQIRNEATTKSSPRDARNATNRLDELFNQLQGPYSPLYRAGEWLVVAQNGEDRNSRVVMAFENESEARAAADSLRSVGATNFRGRQYAYADGDVNVLHSVRAAEQAGGMFGMSPAVFETLKDLIDGLNVGGEGSAEFNALKETLTSAVTNLYASGLPGANIAQRAMLLHRQGVMGASTQLRRAVADTAKSMGFLIARASTEPKLQQSLHAMRAQSREAGALQNRRAIVTNHMAELNRMHREPSSSTFSNVTGQLGYLMYLGFSPSFVMLQALQSPMLTFPVLAARYGYGTTYTHMARAMADSLAAVTKVASDEVKNAWSGARTAALSATPFGRYISQLTAGGALREDTVYDPEARRAVNAEQDMLRAAFEQGLINITMAHDVQAVARGEPQWTRALMRTASWAPQQAEMANRVSTALAAYRLAKEDPNTWQRAEAMRAVIRQQMEDSVRRGLMGTKAYEALSEQEQLDTVAKQTAEAMARLDERLLHEAAMEVAIDTLDRTQFDYSGANKPMLMSGAKMRYLAPVFMFKSYTQHMLHLLLSNAREAMRGETPEAKRVARRTLAGIFAAHALVAGVSGAMVPFGWGVADVLSDVFGEDDDGLDEGAQAKLYAALRATFGKTAADVAMYGLPRLAGVDISARVGLNTLNILPQAPINSGRDGAREWLTNLMGPAASMVVNYWEAADTWRAADFDKTLTLTAPKFLADAVRAYAQATKGLETRAGLQAISPDQYSALSLVAQAFGFTAAERQDYYRARKVQSAIEKQIGDAKGEIKRKFADAIANKDDAARREAEEALREYNRGKTGADRLTIGALHAYVKSREKEQARLTAGELSRSPAATAAARSAE